MKAVQFTAYGADIIVQEVIMHFLGDVAFAPRQNSMFISHNTPSAPINLENTNPLSQVVVTYTARPAGGTAPRSLCLEGLK